MGIDGILIEIDGEMKTINFRRSAEGDEWQIQRLLYNCWGNWDMEEDLQDVENGRYLCAFDESGRLVAITGITDKFCEFNGLVVDNCCVEPRFRGHGIMTALIEQEIKRVGRQQDIYCDCWVTEDINRPNLHRAMNDCGFERLYTARNRNSLHEKDCVKRCIRYSKDGCQCREDVYMLRKEEETGRAPQLS